MKTIQEIRRDNARKLRDGAGGNSSFAALMDREATQISRIIGKNPTKNIGDDMARHMEKCFSLPTGWLDQEHNSSSTNTRKEVFSPAQEIRWVPVISWVQAGAWAEMAYTETDLSLLENFPCPVPCGPLTYILRVVGDSMIHEYKPGDMIFVDPEVPPDHGDDVIALMTDTGETTFKRLVEDGSQKYLKALNPDWPDQYIRINGNCSIIGTVVFSGKPRR